jgi:hypothetical protein
MVERRGDKQTDDLGQKRLGGKVEQSSVLQLCSMLYMRDLAFFFFLLNRFQRARPTLPKGERGEGSCSTVLEPKFTPSTWMDHQYPLFFFFLAE